MQWWQQMAIVLPTVVAGIFVAGWLLRGVRRMWRLGSKMNRWLDQVLGEPPRDGRPGRPSLMQRVEAIEAAQDAQARLLAEHIEWHGEPGASPAGPGPRPVPPRPATNTGRRR